MLKRPVAPVDREVSVVERTPRRVVNCLEAGRLLNIKECTVRKMVKDGLLPAVWVGRLLKIEIADIEQYMDNRKEGQGASARPDAPAHGY